MTYLIIKHKVQDYAKWKPIYDAHGAVRKQFGCKNEQLYHFSDEPNSLLIVTEWDSVDQARRFCESEEVRETMRLAGVQGTPEFQYLELLEKKVTGEGLKKSA